jgi:hypothetical protein
MGSVASPPSGVAQSNTIPSGSTNGVDSTPKQSAGADTSHFTLRDVAVENFRPLRVIVIGAGFSGIYLSIRFPELLRNVEFVVYEKNPGVGGTWWENRYPGCACDIPGKFCDPDPGSGGDNFGVCDADGWCSVLPCQHTRTCILSSRTQSGRRSTRALQRSKGTFRRSRTSTRPVASSSSAIRSPAASGTLRN